MRLIPALVSGSSGYVDTHRPSDLVEAEEPAAQAQPGRYHRRGARRQREEQRGRVEHGEQRGHPRRQRPGRAEPDKRQVGRVALRDVGRPALPPLVQVGQRVDRRHARSERVMGAGQQFRSPGRHAGPRVEQRHLGLPPVERGVQRRQVGDLQRTITNPVAAAAKTITAGAAPGGSANPSVNSDDPAAVNADVTPPLANGHRSSQ